MLDSKQQEEDEEIWDDAYITPDFLRSLDDLEQSINVKPPQPSAVVLSRSMSAPASLEDRDERELSSTFGSLKASLRRMVERDGFSGLQVCGAAVRIGVRKSKDVAKPNERVYYTGYRHIVDVVGDEDTEDTWAYAMVSRLVSNSSISPSVRISQQSLHPILLLKLRRCGGLVADDIVTVRDKRKDISDNISGNARLSTDGSMGSTEDLEGKGKGDSM
ncbi:hypothetical protein BC829DRAFT_446800 [Chytridium lagenaria]|nr:hypothetical protein BC829DRAFT_446800 [Chytridium lagenaria]